MLKPEVCEDLKVEAKPRISVSALLDVLKLIGAQPSALADTPRVVQNPQEEVGMHNNENPVIRQRKLHFEDDELWTRLPDSVQERCRSLWKELLASVPKKDERRRHERED